MRLICLWICPASLSGILPWSTSFPPGWWILWLRAIWVPEVELLNEVLASFTVLRGFPGIFWVIIPCPFDQISELTIHISTVQYLLNFIFLIRFWVFRQYFFSFGNDCRMDRCWFQQRDMKNRVYPHIFLAIWVYSSLSQSVLQFRKVQSFWNPICC